MSSIFWAILGYIIRPASKREEKKNPKLLKLCILLYLMSINCILKNGPSWMSIISAFVKLRKEANLGYIVSSRIAWDIV